MKAGRKILRGSVVAFAIGAALLVAIVAVFAIRPAGDPKVTIGANDEVYYYRRATSADALALGQALQKIGFLNDRGTSVLLWKGSGRTVVSFVLNQGAWNHPDAVANFGEIGRRVAPAVGGFPIKVCLLDAARVVRKELAVGKAAIGARDVVYYFGSATQEDAAALGQALQAAGYFADAGLVVGLMKDGGTTVSFVVQEGIWEQPAAVATLQRLVRQVASSVGGLPITLRLLNAQMETKAEAAVQ
jgi:hypothetical protein